MRISNRICGLALFGAVTLASCSQAQSLPNITAKPAAANSAPTGATSGRMHSMANCSGGADTCTHADAGGGGGGGGLDGNDVPGAGGYTRCLSAGPRGVTTDCSGGGGGGGRVVSTAVPYSGAACDGAEAHGIPIVLGTSNIPGGTSGSATSVVNIYSIQSASGYVAGWVYTTENNSTYFEGNPNMLPILSLLSGALADTVNSPTLESPANLQIIKNSEEQGSFHEHHCFSGNLPASDLG